MYISHDLKILDENRGNFSITITYGKPKSCFGIYPQLSPSASQPPQKSYLDFNDGWPQSSWEITEPAIYDNAAYILLLSHFSTGSVVPDHRTGTAFGQHI